MIPDPFTRPPHVIHGQVGCCHMLCHRHVPLSLRSQSVSTNPALPEIALRSGDPTSQFNGIIKVSHCHFNGRKAREDHNISQTTKVADAEYLAIQLSKSDSKGNPIPGERMLRQQVTVKPPGRHNGAYRV